MCGIAGVVELDADGQGDPAALHRMVDAMSTRGPDDHGTLMCSRAALGVRRLSVIDLETGHQPISNEDNTIHVVLNGELYSHHELRSELLAAGHRFRTRSDTEVLVHGYEAWGIEGLLERLNGMFAFALHDERRALIFLARDRLGIKPLVYARSGSRLYFASTIPALLASREVPVAPDPAGIRHYLQRQFVPEPDTVLAGVRKLPSASYLRIAGGQVGEAKRYWSLPDAPQEDRSDHDWRTDLGVLLDDATRINMIADVGVGVFLSGGLDSSIVLGLMTRHCERPVDAFTIGFGEAGFDESRFARMAADRFGATLHHTEFTAHQFGASAMDVIASLSEPVGDAACIPLFELARAARRHVKVVLTGEGADELFSGYGYYRRIATPANRAVTRVKRSIGRAAPCAASGYPYVMSAADTRALTPAWGAPNGTGDRQFLRAERGARNGHDALNDAARVDIAGFLVDDLLAKVDSTTMAHSLEARVPFLDHRVVEMALKMPGRLKRRGGAGKIILRETFGDLLGPQLAGRDKHGFSLPLASWFRGRLRPLIEDSLGDVTATPWLEPQAVRRLLAEHAQGRDHARALWAIFVLTEWHRSLHRPSATQAGATAWR
ncbi:MAG TPA: asparagine synthase (glutamine-hydrolyzing) [Candidatus Krumholzibacteria bacterium]|nr:asparagine synthase (glutamine-hydrolyzing) [Candidatus Krumholzibacteria bacterium]